MTSPAMSDPMTPPAEVREALRALEKAADAHDYFARNSDLHMTTGDHAREAKRIRAALADLTAQLTEANALRERDGKDAERYRWLREQASPQFTASVVAHSESPSLRRSQDLHFCTESWSEMNAAIDAAIQARKQEDTNARTAAWGGGRLMA
jgi:hypothetical protein